MSSNQLVRDGFSVERNVVDKRTLDQIIAAVERLPTSPGSVNVRGLLGRVPKTCALLECPRVRELVADVLGPTAVVVRSLLFDKVTGANWNVPWHQDQIIAVAERHDVPGFAAWSLKEGVPHVRPPAEVLARMLTLRFHLDRCDLDNGPLKVLPGSHREGFLSSDAVAAWVARREFVVCTVEPGDLVVMRPLLLHASDRAIQATHRRVVHFDLASGSLPGGLEWHCERRLAGGDRSL